MNATENTMSFTLESARQVLQHAKPNEVSLTKLPNGDLRIDIQAVAFETQQMVSKLNSSVARNMMTFAHYRFKQFLKAKGQEYQCDVVEVSEAYTTKTCSYCGKQHNMGSKKVMKCSCGVHVDRDLNGTWDFSCALSVTT
ncbi:MAG: zinc ribbon domain-containing protein [Thiotrichaceae bacterium]